MVSSGSFFLGIHWQVTSGIPQEMLPGILLGLYSYIIIYFTL